LNASVLEYLPRKVVGAAILLAAKSEEARINTSDLAKLTNNKLKDITSLELILLQVLKFHLRVFHAYRALRGFVAALAALIPEPKRSSIEKRARQLIEMSYFTGNECIV
jgi:hypothetical protein